MAKAFRVYEPNECGSDGYPFIWHRNDGSLDALIDALDLDPSAGLKHIVRAQADNRCLRCCHPFVVGESGVMEGPLGAHAKAFAADIGFNHDLLDDVLLEMHADGLIPNTDAETEKKALERARRVNWSDCDALCTHGGPVRARVTSERPWEMREDEGPQFPISQGNEAQAAWRILTVHHLDEVKANLRWWNLVALCQRCHLLIQRKVTMEHPWPWEHSEWFRPYAAAWYALKYRGEDLNRLQTMARLDKLLDLGKREESVERMPL